MNYGIDMQQPSTIRGIVWGITALIGIIGWWIDKDITPVLLIGAAVAGGLGVATKDK
jgi:hypothetical protein